MLKLKYTSHDDDGEFGNFQCCGDRFKNLCHNRRDACLVMNDERLDIRCGYHVHDHDENQPLDDGLFMEYPISLYE